MIKSHYLPNKEFATKEELFLALKENLDVIIDAKKSVQKSCDKNASVICRPLDISKFDNEQQKSLNIDDNFYYIVVNTTKILDSHDDVHIDGLWKKTINEKQYKNYLVTDHELEILNTVVRKEYVEILTIKLPFATLGYSYAGNTEALVYKVPKNQVKNELVKDWLESGDAIQGSVRMKYIKFLFCIDSNAPEDAEFKKNYDNYIDTIANKSDFDYIPYFFAILEASNEQEASLVIRGSNHVTGNYNTTRNQEEKIKPLSDTLNNEPLLDTQKEASKPNKKVIIF